MILPLDITTAITTKALDGLFARQTVTAQNIANANSEHFVPMQVTFEDALREAVAPGPSASSADVLARIACVTPTREPSLPDALGGVRLDQEVTMASETAARYAVLIGMLDRTLQIQQLAITGG